MAYFQRFFPVEFQGQRDGDGGGDDGQRQQPRQCQRKNRGCYGLGVIDQSTERAYGGADEEGHQKGDPPGLFRAETKHQRNVDVQQNQSHAQSGQRKPQRTVEAREKQREDALERKHDRAASGDAEPAQRIPAEHHSPIRIGQHPGKAVPAAPLVIGHDGIGDHGAVDHRHEVEIKRGDDAPDEKQDEPYPKLLPQYIPIL